MQSDVDQAVKVFNQGGIVIFPTDTAYGIGCRIDRPDAITRLFAIRRRPANKPTPVLLSSLKMAERYLKPVSNEVVTKLIKQFWPGALTIVLSCNTESVSNLVRGGGKSLGVRVPDHLTTLALIQSVGVPILGPSANFHGEQTPFSQRDVDPQLVKLADYTVSGVCHNRLSSTVIDCTRIPWKVLRKGAINL